MKFTFDPNCILSPFGNVNNLLSSNTLFRLSTHNGSISPSHIIQHLVFLSSNTTFLAFDVNIPSLNSLVS